MMANLDLSRWSGMGTFDGRQCSWSPGLLPPRLLVRCHSCLLYKRDVSRAQCGPSQEKKIVYWEALHIYATADGTAARAYVSTAGPK
jgi:hypothetical protein